MSTITDNPLATPDIRHLDRRRGHRFTPPQAELRRIPPLRTNEGPLDDIIIHLHYFVGGCDWWIAEYDPADGTAFGYVIVNDPNMGEWGNIPLPELGVATAGATLNGIPFRQPVERDKWWTPCRWADVDHR